jgi:hypothetical protein
MEEQKKLKILRLLSYSFTILTIVFILNYDYFVTTSSEEQMIGWCGVIDEENDQGEGRKLFKVLCASCHKLDKRFIGPTLGGIIDRREKGYLIGFIKNENSLRKVYPEISNDTIVKMNHRFSQLTKEQVNEILDYVSN